MKMKPKVLFIMYDGLTDPLGQSQVLTYLKGLSKFYSVDILGFEKEQVYQAQKNHIQQSIKNKDIKWIPLKYNKKPPIFSTLFDMYQGWKAIKQNGDQSKYDLIHCRSISMGNLALAAKSRYNAKLIFDMRGWWADEKKESGLWKSWIFRPIYFYFKKLEARLFQESDQVISLTHAGATEIVDKKLKLIDQVSVIPTCVDFEVFQPFNPGLRQEIRKSLKISRTAKVILYSGSLGGNYSLEIIEKLYKAFKIQELEVVILFLTTSKGEVQAQLADSEILPEDIRMHGCSYAEVYRYLMVGDIGVVNYKKTFSAIGRSPTKLGEYWACGLPAICEKGIGDVDFLITKYPSSGFLVDLNISQDFIEAVEFFNSNQLTALDLRNYALDYYALINGIHSYENIYRRCIK